MAMQKRVKLSKKTQSYAWARLISLCCLRRVAAKVAKKIIAKDITAIPILYVMSMST
jgi:hypothetical protein